MRRRDQVIYNATKVGGNGSIDYCIWIDDQLECYIQLLANNIDTKNKGTFSSGVAYSVSKYKEQRHNTINNLESVNVNSGAIEPDTDNNNNAFFRAALLHYCEQSCE